ncbi:cytochrome c biogenesis CcdA family protein [Marisediminicola sp. LYQ134]|uniref:cytochrome c biogenesis CcdA family protein n=1 Tax=unclassified Marisediminicola TaxID=2618316 RepID=UPI0039832FB6
MDSIGEIVGGGTLLLALPIALLAGLVSFASPCVLPLVPGYLGYVGGFAGSDERGSRRRLLLGVALFVLGFSVVFVGFNLAFSIAGLLLLQWVDLITRIAGVIVIVMGLVFIGQFTFLQRTIKPSFTVATGLGGAPLLGIVFGLGWAPCIGPTLAVILNLSLTSGSAGRGVLLGIAYSLGLGIPFLLVALGFGWVTGSVAWLKRNIRTVNIVGGSMLILLGILMVSGVWQWIMSNLTGVILGFEPAI